MNMTKTPLKCSDETMSEKRIEIENILANNHKVQSEYLNLISRLSVRAKNVLKHYDLWDAIGLLPWFEGKYDDFSILRNCGQKTARELAVMFKTFRKYVYSFLFEGNNEGNVVLAKDRDLISHTERTVLGQFFENLLGNLSAGSYNYLNSENLLDVDSFCHYFLKRNVNITTLPIGRKTAVEIQQMIFSLRKCIESQKSLQENIAIDVFKSLPSDMFLTLTEQDRAFVADFKTKHGHFPMFFLLKDYFTHSKSKSDKMFSELCGFPNGQFVSINDLSEHWGYSIQATKQKISYVVEHLSKTLRLIMDMPDWGSYEVLKHPYLINYDFQETARQECLTNTFCVYMLLKLRGKIVYFYDKVNLTINSYTDTLSNVETVILDNNYAYFNIKKVMREIKRLSKLKSDQDLRIPLLSYFINNEDFWDSTTFSDNVLKTDEQSMLLLLENLLKDTELIHEHNLIIKASRHNYKDILYCILKEKCERLHIEDLFHEFVERLKSVGTSSPFTDSSQIKKFLIADDRIVAIGKSSYWGLKEWGELLGSVKSVLIRIISQSESPMKIEDLAKETFQIRPDSSIKSITSVIYQCTYSGELDLFFDNYVYLSGKSSDFSGFVLFPRSFDDWISVFRQFVLENQRFPYSNQKGYEGYLYRWCFNAQKLINLNAEEILKFESLMEELSPYPHNSKEKSFIDNCNLYKIFVENNRRMVSREDDRSLYSWFNNTKRDFDKLDGNMELYFSQLLKTIITVLTDNML